MLQKHIPAVITCFLFFLASTAQKKDTIQIPSTLNKATVYYGYGADLQHAAKANLKSGVQTIVINNVSLYPDINTIQLSCPEYATILSFSHRIYYIPPIPKPLPNHKKSFDTISQLQKTAAWFFNQAAVNEDVINRTTRLIENNFITPDKKNISSEELIKLTAFYTDKISLLKQRNYDISVKRDSINQKIEEINNRLQLLDQLAYESTPSKPVGQLILQVMSKEAGLADFDCSYFTRNAGWIPNYDIRVKTIDNTFKLVYKAMVSQTTGLDWSGVKLTLSTSNPNMNNNSPMLYPIYMQLYTPVLYQTLVRSTNEVAVTNAAPQMFKDEVEYADNTKSLKMLAKESDVSNYLQLSESQLNINYEIELPYDIPTDGMAYSVNIKEEKIDVIYQHLSIPKLDNDAFLVAKITQWSELNLLPGQSNIIMDNVYLGKSYLDPNITSDTLQLSLGRDKRVVVERKTIKQTLGQRKGDQRQNFYTYEITIRNNKKQAIALNLQDQYPISRDKQIEVTLKDDGGATVDPETGFMNWEIKLAPGETKKVRFSYQVKYPKDKQIQEVR
jgi:uncharacterized protein (TIGR02231 family)